MLHWYVFETDVKFCGHGLSHKSAEKYSQEATLHTLPHGQKSIVNRGVHIIHRNSCSLEFPETLVKSTAAYEVMWWMDSNYKIQMEGRTLRKNAHTDR